LQRRSASRQQDLNDDDRKHLKWCLEAIEKGISRGKIEKFADAMAALDFITALLERDYNLYPERRMNGRLGAPADSRHDENGARAAPPPSKGENSGDP
jgi:hypothetical protein